MFTKDFLLGILISLFFGVLFGMAALSFELSIITSSIIAVIGAIAGGCIKESRRGLSEDTSNVTYWPYVVGVAATLGVMFGFGMLL